MMPVRQSRTQPQRNMTAPSTKNLTGIWHGLYSYPRRRPAVPFVATLIESGSSLSGTTHEQCGSSGHPDQMMYATLLGHHQGQTVAFVKTYDGDDPHYGSVAYEGIVSDDGTEIEGRWLVPGHWSGKFLMIRSAGNSEAITLEAFQRV